MAKPLSRILVVEDEPLVLREIVKGLNAAIEADGDMQAVLVDDKLYSLPGAKKGNGRKKLQLSALELVQRITRLRPVLDVYVLIAQESEDDVVDAVFTEAVDGYFYREERVCADGIVHAGYQPCLRVLLPAEERSLHRLA